MPSWWWTNWELLMPSWWWTNRKLLMPSWWWRNWELLIPSDDGHTGSYRCHPYDGQTGSYWCHPDDGHNGSYSCHPRSCQFLYCIARWMLSDWTCGVVFSLKCRMSEFVTQHGIWSQQLLKLLTAPSHTFSRAVFLMAWSSQFKYTV